MRFWDSSAIIPLLIEEPRSPDAAELIRTDGVIVASALTPVEVASTLWRKRHAGKLQIAAHDEAERRFAELSRRWQEVENTAETIRLALSIVSRHSLRSMDALQLAAALLAAGTRRDRPFVTFDSHLASAARERGLHGSLVSRISLS